MRFVLLACAAVFLTGCGYVGDPLPPALNIPVAVTDLRAIQRGDKLMLDFTAPSLTTDDLVMTRIAGVTVLLGDEKVSAPGPEPGSATHIEIPAGPYVGKEALVRVTLSGPKGQSSAESNIVTLRVLEPLAPPSSVQAVPHPEGIRVTWKAAAASYRLQREPRAEAVSMGNDYIDRNVELGKEYKYTVTAVTGTAQSLPSEPVTATARDIFAPAAPVNLSAIAGVNSIELAWDRNTEADLRSYRVYRNGTLIARDVDTPSFSDKQIMPGQRYRYEVTAADALGNESSKSAALEITGP